MTEQDVRDHQQLLRSLGYEAEAIDLGIQVPYAGASTGRRVRAPALRAVATLPTASADEGSAESPEGPSAMREWEQKCNAFIEQMARARLPLPPNCLSDASPDIEEPIPHHAPTR
jgi:hypothetical protein